MKRQRTVQSMLGLWIFFSLMLAACGVPPATEPATTPPPAAQATQPPPAPAEATPTSAPAEPTSPPEPSSEKYGGTLIVTYSQEPTSFDPPKAFSTMDWGTAAQL